MTKLERVLKGLEEMGTKTRAIEDIKQTIDLLGDIDIVHDRDENFKIRFSKNGEFKLETSWSNQEITAEWLERANRIFKLLNEN